MLINSPGAVTLGDLTLGGVERIVIERSAHRVLEEWTDGGRYPVYADVPAQRISVRLERRTSDGRSLGVSDLAPGYMGELRFFAGAHALDTPRTAEVRVLVVVTGVRYELERDPARQIITMLGVSDKVDEDPVSVAYDGAAAPSAASAELSGGAS